MDAGGTPLVVAVDVDSRAAACCGSADAGAVCDADCIGGGADNMDAPCTIIAGGADSVGGVFAVVSGGVDTAPRVATGARPESGGALTVFIVEIDGVDSTGRGAGTVGGITGFVATGLAGAPSDFAPRGGCPGSGGSVSAEEETSGWALGRGALTAGASDTSAGGTDEVPIARASMVTARLKTIARSRCPVALADSAACLT